MKLIVIELISSSRRRTHRVRIRFSYQGAGRLVYWTLVQYEYGCPNFQNLIVVSEIPLRHLRRAAEEFALPQIKIVCPKLVVCLGSDTFGAICLASGKKPSQTLASAIDSPFRLGRILIWCQAHPGGRAESAEEVGGQPATRWNAYQVRLGNPDRKSRGRHQNTVTTSPATGRSYSRTAGLCDGQSCKESVSRWNASFAGSARTPAARQLNGNRMAPVRFILFAPND